MDLTQLDTLVHVAWQRGFSQAAIILGVSQSTVSNRVARLEKELGQALFDRHGNYVELTDEGQVFLSFAEKMVGLRSEALRTLSTRDRHTDARRVLRLGSNNTSAEAVLPGVLEQFHCTTQGETKVNLLVESTRTLMPALMEGVVEIAFANPDFAHRFCKVLWSYESPILLVAYPGHRFAGATVRPVDLGDEAFLTYSFGSVSRVINRLQSIIGRDVQSVVVSNDTSLVRSLAVSGLGLSFLPRACMQAELAAGTLVEVEIAEFEQLRWETVLVHWRDRPPSPEAEDFLAMLPRQRMSWVP